MVKITSLTQEQKDLLPKWRDDWTAIGLSCDPLDFDLAKDAAGRAYRSAGLEPPNVYVTASSPLSAALAGAILSSREEEVLDHCRNKTYTQRIKRVKPLSGVALAALDTMLQYVMAVEPDLDSSDVNDQLRKILIDAISTEGWRKTSESVKSALSNSCFGSHDAAWLSFYSFFLEVVGLDCVEPLRPLIDLSKVCGWWIPYDKMCILQHRHQEVHRDEQGRLHNMEGMAVRYLDGFGCYAVHGVQMPAWPWEEPEKLSAEAIDREDNLEIKRVLIDRYGIERYIAELNLTPVDKAGGDDYVLYRRRIPGEQEDLVVLKCANFTFEPDEFGNKLSRCSNCGSVVYAPISVVYDPVMNQRPGRPESICGCDDPYYTMLRVTPETSNLGKRKDYFLRVPPTVRDAWSAVAWTFGQEADEFKPAARS